MLIKLRLWFYCVALAHLAFIVIYLLSIDFTKAKDPSLWIYDRTRWKLITTWFNLLSLIYLPVCVYCEWKALNGNTESPLVKLLNDIRTLCFTSILLPTTTFADLLFWRLWCKDRELLVPTAVDPLVPFWIQHSMHSVSLVVIILDMLLTPRRRPRSHKTGVTLMFVFVFSYILVVLHSKIQGEYIYPFIKNLTNLQSIIFALLTFVEHSLYYSAQWIIVDIVWSQQRKHKVL